MHQFFVLQRLRDGRLLAVHGEPLPLFSAWGLHRQLKTMVGTTGTTVEVVLATRTLRRQIAAIGEKANNALMYLHSGKKLEAIAAVGELTVGFSPDF